jgi:hypothetical protein
LAPLINVTLAEITAQFHAVRLVAAEQPKRRPPCAPSRRKKQTTARAYLSVPNTDSGLERPFVINGLDALVSHHRNSVAAVTTDREVDAALAGADATTTAVDQISLAR